MIAQVILIAITSYILLGLITSAAYAVDSFRLKGIKLHPNENKAHVLIWPLIFAVVILVVIGKRDTYIV